MWTTIEWITFGAIFGFTIISTVHVFGHYNFNGSIATSYGEQRYEYGEELFIHYQLFVVAFVNAAKFAISCIISDYFPQKRQNFLVFCTVAMFRLSCELLYDARIKGASESSLVARISLHAGATMGESIQAMHMLTHRSREQTL